MFQKEVAQRICEKEGSKTYGILSVLVLKSIPRSLMLRKGIPTIVIHAYVEP